MSALPTLLPVIRSRWPAFAAAACMLLLAACGGSGPGDGGPTAGSTGADAPGVATALAAAASVADATPAPTATTVGDGASASAAAAGAEGSPAAARSDPVAELPAASEPPPAAPVAAPPAAVVPALPPQLAAGQMAVVYAEGDATSEAIARAYQLARGIPAQQVVGVRLPQGVGHAIGADDFAQLKAGLDARLGEHVQALLVTWTRPSRVAGPCSMSLTSALAFGFDARHCGGCSRTAASPYYDHDTARPWTELGVRPAMMLGAASLADANALIARGLAAEGLMSAGARPRGWLVRTSDTARSVRWPDFVQTVAGALGGVDWRYLDNSGGSGSNVVAESAGVMFYLTGLSRVPQIDQLHWLPGAVADHLTSYAGVLPDGAGQMPATAWLAAGATGSYGTVEEPCNHVQKFPRASVLTQRYGRGETLIEAYWKSVQWPGQGLFVGDPLARPWPRT